MNSRTIVRLVTPYMVRRALCILLVAASAPGALQGQNGPVVGLGGFGALDRGIGGILDLGLGPGSLSYVGARAMLSNDLQGNVAAYGLIVSLELPLIDSYPVVATIGIAATSRSNIQDPVRPAVWGGVAFPLLRRGGATLLGSMFATVDTYDVVPLIGLEVRYSFSGRHSPSQGH